MNNKTIPDGMAIHSMMGFFNTFIYLYENYFNKQKPIPFNLSNQVMYSFPYAVNGAFAIEIALKSFMDEKNARQCGHDLKKAFHNNQVPDNVRIAIKNRFTSLLPDRTQEEANFDVTLTKASNLFVQWRYGFQSADSIMVPEYFFELTDSICRVIAELYDRTVTEH